MLSFPAPRRPKAWGIRSVALALVGVAAVSAAFSAARPAHAEDAPSTDTIGVSAAPLSPEGTSPRSRFSYQMSPGQTLDDTYVVTNVGSTPQTYTVFATDAFNTDEGGYGLLETGVTPTDAGAWVDFGGQPSVSVALEPGASTEVPFHLAVPADAGPGDHAAGLVVSALANDGQVLVDRRVGTRLYVRVPGDLQPIMSIDGMSASYAPSLNPLDGETTVTFTVRNAGNVALAGRLKAEVRGLFGVGVSGVVESDVDEMLPGSTRTVTTTLSGVGQWVYLAPSVTLYPSIDDQALNPGPLRSVSRDTVLFVVPWALLLVVLVGLLVWGWLRLRRRVDERRARAWVEYTEAEARRKAETEREAVSAGAAGGTP